jgi:carboxypeptidase Taq
MRDPRVSQVDKVLDRQTRTLDIVDAGKVAIGLFRVPVNEEWVAARVANDYARFAPWLEKQVGLARQLADCLGYEGERYDALIDQYEQGATASSVRAVFDSLKPELVALVRAIADRGTGYVDASPIHRSFDEKAQRAFGERVIRDFGFDFERGRQDEAVHPFCTTFAHGDVRITTRFERNFLSPALFGTMHETGHALYEQGVAAELDGNILFDGTSLGIHESQSRLWENLVGRSLPFWEHYYGDLQSAFPGTLDDVDLRAFYQAINNVEPSLIRVEADEVTYNLHVLLRFELETDLLDGRLDVKDAPEAWNAKMQEYLGLTPPTDALGILQDVHWSGGMIGYFPTYTLGNVISVQLFEQANTDLGGNMDEQIRNGEFSGLLGWLRENVHRHGRKYPPKELMMRVTGKPIDTKPYLCYLGRKFGDLYHL